MIKKLSALVLAIAIVMCGSFPCVEAVELDRTVEYLPDGSYIVTTITEGPTMRDGTKTASKSMHNYNANDELQWMIVVTGTFTYNGTTAQCTNVSGSTSIVATNSWSKVSEEYMKSGATATYTVTFGIKTLGIALSQRDFSVHLTCDANGNLS